MRFRSLLHSPWRRRDDAAWTLNASGCACHFNASRTDCACCLPGGCQCGVAHAFRCVECGDDASACAGQICDDSMLRFTARRGERPCEEHSKRAGFTPRRPRGPLLFIHAEVL
eukprot:224293-Pleurochrysis_carterae.AAC.5